MSQDTCTWPLTNFLEISGVPTTLRKRVLQRKQAATQNSDHAKFVTILEDRSVGKQDSHNHLYFFIQKHSVPGVKKVYTKDQFVKLCKAYGVRVRTRQNKQKLAAGLVEAIKALNRNDMMPHPHCLYNLSAQTQMNDGGIVVRITRSHLS